MINQGVWTQNTDPLGNPTASALLAAVPIVVLFYALAIRRMPGHLAGLLTVGAAILVAALGFGMPPGMAVLSALYGALYGLFPIGWIVIMAVFLYNITVRIGQFEVVKDSIASITRDRRLQALLIAFSFGAFLEGVAGFGTPVAISGAMLVGLGFNPLYAAGICLIANTAPVAFAAIGIPIIVAGDVSGVSVHAISQSVGRQLVLLSILVPFWLVHLMSGWRGVKEVWPAALVSGGSFALAQWVAAEYLGPLLPAIAGSLASIVALVLFLHLWKPPSIWRFPEEPPATYQAHAFTRGKIVRAWSPFIILTILAGAWGMGPVRTVLDAVTVHIPFPGLHSAFAAPGAAPTMVIYHLNWLSAAGTSILIAALLTLALFGVGWRESVNVFGETVWMLRFPLATIMAVLGFAYVANFSGMSVAMGQALTATGAAYPLFAPLLGWVGVFITGSDTSANALFGRLQVVAAEGIGVNPVLTVAANTTGGVTGKMISPQSIAVATAAAGLVGRESDLFRFTLKHSLLFLAIVALITYVQAYYLPGLVPPFAPAAPPVPVAVGGQGWLYLSVVAGLVLLLGLYVSRHHEPR